MSSTDTPGQVASMEGLAGMVERLERTEYEQWVIRRQRMRGYGSELTDAEFVMRDQRGEYTASGFEMGWQAWKARSAWNRPCRGVTREGCNYLAACGSVCNKCGEVH